MTEQKQPNMRAILLFGTIKYNCYCIHSLREVKVVQSCLTLCDHMDAVHGILQARILEWVEFPFFRESSLLPSLWDLPNPGVEPRSPALQADSLPAEQKRKLKNTGTGSLSSPEDLPDPGIEPGYPALQAEAIWKLSCTDKGKDWSSLTTSQGTPS